MTIRTWVDIEDAAGQKLGGGPLVSVTDWTQTARLDRAGDFAFSMPATDARAAYVRPKRFARCWHSGPEGIKSLGYGRIERVELRESAEGPRLEVSGCDLLGELADRIMRRVALRTEVTEHPEFIDVADLSFNIGLYDYQPGDTTTYSNFAGGFGGFAIIGSLTPFHRITWNLGTTVNTTAGANRYQYSKAGGFVNFPAGAVTDTTYVGPNPMAQDGTMSFTPPNDWEPLTGESQYKFRLLDVDPSGWSAGGIDCYDVTISYYKPTNDALNDIMDFAPDGWSLDAANGYTELQYRPLTSTELMTNGGLETVSITGGGASDDFANWDEYDGPNNTSRVLAVAGHAGSYGAKLLTGPTAGNQDYAAFWQVSIPVSDNTEYTLTFWTHGDGTYGSKFNVWKENGTQQQITPFMYSTNVSASEWSQERYTFTTPPTTTLIYIAFFSPNAANAYYVIDDVSLQAGGGNSIYLQCSDESVLEMLIRVAEATGEHFILSPDGRKVLWLGNDERQLELRAVSNVNPVEVAGVDQIAIITDIAEIEDSSDVVSRVYPYGAGMGGSRVTLASATTEPPSGYTVSTADNYVQRTAAVTALGVVETARSWSDIVEQADDTTAAAQSAANILLIQAVNWLSTHSATSTDRLTGDVPRFYELALAKCERLLLPGYKLRVVHHRWVDGYHAVAIDRDLWITAATWRVGANGAETVRLAVATVDRAAVNDALATATSIRKLTAVQAHNTAAGY
jgi:hypothetical protein